MNLSRSLWAFISLMILACCKPSEVTPQLPSFSSTPSIVTLQTELLNDASGIVDALNFERALWVNNDHDPNLYLLSYDGTLIKKLPIAGTARDWEDIALGPGPEAGRNYIYIAETGDNDEVYPDYSIYRFPEPVPGQESIDDFDTLPFTYSDGKSYDVETLLLDPATKDLYLLTKRQITVAHVFKIPFPQKVGENNIAEHVSTINYGMLTAGDISRDGKEILLKNYANVYYWKVRDGESIASALGRRHDLIAPYVIEPQGEGICFDKTSSGYFTISEKGNSPNPVQLYYYKKEAE